MKNLVQWLEKNQFLAYSSSFIVMIVSSLGLYYVAQYQEFLWVWVLIGLMACANILVVLIP